MADSIRKILLELAKECLEEQPQWSELEQTITLFLVDLPEGFTHEQKTTAIKRLNDMVVAILETGVDEETIKPLTEEIARYEHTVTMSLYMEEEDQISTDLIHSYARLGELTNSIVGIRQPLNYKQLSKLSNAVYNKTKFLKFYISNERRLHGKIIAENFEHAQKIPLVNVYETRHKNDSDDGYHKKVVLFGEKVDKQKYRLLKEIPFPLYVQQFVSDQGEEFMLMTTSQYEPGEHIITGVVTHIDDFKMLTGTARIQTKLPYFFAQSVETRRIKFKSKEDLISHAKSIDFTKENAYQMPFTVKVKEQYYTLKQPEWFKQLIWAWLLHQPKGMFNNYPLHLMMVAEKHTGKSLLLNSLHERSKESQDIFSGSQSTIKALIPSFYNLPVQAGYLALSNRFGYLDEFFRALLKTKTSVEGGLREETVGVMNDLLEHQKREAGSGVGKVKVSATARFIATTNPVKNADEMKKLLDRFDHSFLSRWFIYFQNEDHINLIRESKDHEAKPYKYKLDSNDWHSMLDYLHSFSATYDMEIAHEIKESLNEELPNALLNHYSARHGHHIECLLDGIIKTRCLLEGDPSFAANDDDYNMLRKVWCTVVRSWNQGVNIHEIDKDNKIYYLPELVQDIYWAIYAHKKGVYDADLKVEFSGVKEKEYRYALGTLRGHGLIMEVGGKTFTHKTVPKSTL